MEDIIREFKDKFEHMVINFHKTDNKFYKDILNELIVMNNSIEKLYIKDNFSDVLFEVGKAISFNHEERCQIISHQFERVKEIVLKIFHKTINDLQSRLECTNISDFNIICKNEYDLILAGSFDFAYYHDVEIIFKDVDFIFCPGCTFRINNFRLATNDELLELSKYMHGWEREGFVTCLENTSFSSNKYYIVAQQIKFKFHNVMYEVKEGFICVQRISDWAKEEIELK